LFGLCRLLFGLRRDGDVTTPDGHWWAVVTPGHTVLIPAPADTPAGRLIDQALEALGHRPVVQALTEDGEWRIPTVLVPGAAITRQRWPDRLYDACTVRPATPRDLELAEQDTA
jgi:hypothetical protein